MKPPVVLTSLQNPRIKEAVRLRERNKRDQKMRFLIEGYRELLRATDAGKQVETLFYCESLFLGSHEKELIRRIEHSNAKVFSCKEHVFCKISYRDRPDGLLAIARQSHLKLNDIQLSEHPLIVVAESIEKPGNLGTILRSCDATAVDVLIVCDRCTDIHNPNVVRASVGTLFTVPLVETSSAEAIRWLKKHAITIVAASPDAKKTYTEAALKDRIAIAVGTEQYGLSTLWMDTADQHIRIPMLGKADSLNVATATTLLLYEARRQRA